MANENPGLRLGDLLTNAGLLKPADLREAMLIARQQQLPVGRVLIMSGYLSEGQLQSAVQAQSMVKDGLIDFEGAIQALNFVATDHVPLEEALNRMGWSPNAASITNKLGEFLIAAGLVAAEDVQYALGQCQEIGLPLGRVLVVTGYLTEEMLTNALNAQVLVRDRKITRDQATQGLRAALERQISLEESLQQTADQWLVQNSVRLGELFVGAELIDEANLMNAVEIGLVNEQLIGQVLCDLGLISAELLNSGLELQSMVAYGDISVSEATEALLKCHTDRLSANDSLERLRAQKSQAIEAPPVAPVIEHIPLYQFLQLGGLITQSDIEKAVHAGSKNTEIMGKMLALSGVMSPELVEAAKQALGLIIKNSLNMEQAIVALKNCKSTGNSLSSAFLDLGWDPSSLGADEAPRPQAKGNDAEPKVQTTEGVRQTGSPLLKTLRAARAHSVAQGQAASGEVSEEPSVNFSWSRTSVTPESGPAAFGNTAVDGVAQPAQANAQGREVTTQSQPALPEKAPTVAAHKSQHEMPSVASGWTMNADSAPSISQVQSKYSPQDLAAKSGNFKPVPAAPEASNAVAAPMPSPPDIRRQTGSHQPLAPTPPDFAQPQQAANFQAPAPGDPGRQTGSHQPLQQQPMPGSEPQQFGDPRRQTGSHQPLQQQSMPGNTPQSLPDPRHPSGSHQAVQPVMPGNAPEQLGDPRRQTGSHQPLQQQPMPGSEPQQFGDPRRQTGSHQPIQPPMPGSEPQQFGDPRRQTGSHQPIQPPMPGSEPQQFGDPRRQTGSHQPIQPPMPGIEPQPLGDPRRQTGSHQPIQPPMPGSESQPLGDPRRQTGSHQPLSQVNSGAGYANALDRSQTQPLPQNQPPENSLAPEQGWQSFSQVEAQVPPQAPTQPGFTPGHLQPEATSWANSAQSQTPWPGPAEEPAPAPHHEAIATPPQPQQAVVAQPGDGMPWQGDLNQAASSQPTPPPAEAAAAEGDDSEESQASRRRKNKLNDLMPKSKSKK